MAVREIARRLIDGVWQTVDAEENGGGGTAPVSCVLARDNGFSVRTIGDHPILWDALYDNYNDFNALLEIPAGLGLDFDFDGSSAEITTTTAGVWAFTYTGIAVPNDDTYQGVLDTRFGGHRFAAESGIVLSPVIVTLTLALPTGLMFAPQISTGAQATADPYEMGSAYLIATRLG